MIGSFRISDDATCDWGQQIELFFIQCLASDLYSIHLVHHRREVLLELGLCCSQLLDFIYGAQLWHCDPFVSTLNFMVDLLILNQLLLCLLLKIFLHQLKRAHFDENRLFRVKRPRSWILTSEVLLILWVAQLRRGLSEVVARFILSEVHHLKNFPGALSIKSFHQLPMIAIPITFLVGGVPMRRLGSSIFCSRASLWAFASARASRRRNVS